MTWGPVALRDWLATSQLQNWVMNFINAILLYRLDSRSPGCSQILFLMQLEPSLAGIPHDIKLTWGNKAIKRDLKTYGEEELRFYFL